jgi:hypothetical protein
MSTDNKSNHNLSAGSAQNTFSEDAFGQDGGLSSDEELDRNILDLQKDLDNKEEDLENELSGLINSFGVEQDDSSRESDEEDMKELRKNGTNGKSIIDADAEQHSSKSFKKRPSRRMERKRSNGLEDKANRSSFVEAALPSKNKYTEYFTTAVNYLANFIIDKFVETIEKNQQNQYLGGPNDIVRTYRNPAMKAGFSLQSGFVVVAETKDGKPLIFVETVDNSLEALGKRLTDINNLHFVVSLHNERHVSYRISAVRGLNMFAVSSLIGNRSLYNRPNMPVDVLQQVQNKMNEVFKAKYDECLKSDIATIMADHTKLAEYKVEINEEDVDTLLKNYLTTKGKAVKREAVKNTLIKHKLKNLVAIRVSQDLASETPNIVMLFTNKHPKQQQHQQRKHVSNRHYVRYVNGDQYIWGTYYFGIVLQDPQNLDTFLKTKAPTIDNVRFTSYSARFDHHESQSTQRRSRGTIASSSSRGVPRNTTPADLLKSLSSMIQHNKK